MKKIFKNILLSVLAAVTILPTAIAAPTPYATYPYSTNGASHLPPTSRMR